MKKKDTFLKKIVVGNMKANCYILGDSKTREVFIIDPGSDEEKIRTVINKYDLKVKAIINTHGHIDHISGNKYFDLPIWIHREDSSFLLDAKKNLSSLVGFNLKSPEATRLLDDGEIISVGDLSLEVIHTPGHTPGSICLKTDGMLFTGDILFCGGIGRTDFPLGSEESLYHSLKNRVLIHDDDVIVYPGHGPSTTIGNEKKGTLLYNLEKE